MRLGLLVFLLAFLIRFINLLFLDLDTDNYLIEDQKFYWEWSLKSAYLPWSELSAELFTELLQLIDIILFNSLFILFFPLS